jgi:hypothetical protein
MNQQPTTVKPRTMADLEALIRAGHDVPALIITPALALPILEQWNGGNRRRDEVTVQRYRRDMDANRWLAGGEIAFGVVEGAVVLGNGQHRIAAQVAAGVPQQYNARIFSDSDDFEVYVLSCDGGRNRTLADQFKIFGITESANAAAIFERTVNAMQNFLGQKAARLSKQERMDFALQYVKSVRYALSLPSREFKAHLLAAIVFAHDKKAKPTEAFIAQVMSGAGLAEGSPALVLGQALAEMNAATSFRAKDRAMGHMLRTIHDGINGKKRSAVIGARHAAKPMSEALSTLVSASAADAWVERQSAGKAR